MCAPPKRFLVSYRVFRWKWEEGGRGEEESGRSRDRHPWDVRSGSFGRNGDTVKWFSNECATLTNSKRDEIVAVER